MIELGKMNRLKILETHRDGYFLDDFQGGRIWLEKKPEWENYKAGDEIEVFLFLESTDSLCISTIQPKAQVGEFAKLEVVALEEVGAFLDWGLPKDLFLPFSEQSRELVIGDVILVFLYLDKAQRITASMRIESRHQRHSASSVAFDQKYQPNQPVDLIIYSRTDLGYKAIINRQDLGFLFAQEVFQNLKAGQEIKGYIKKVREDQKIDLSLQALGHTGAQDIGESILSRLRSQDGFLAITDKTSPEKIYELFGVSKKKYKMALGGLYKRKLISIEEKGIRLN